MTFVVCIKKNIAKHDCMFKKNKGKTVKAEERDKHMKIKENF